MRDDLEMLKAWNQAYQFWNLNANAGVPVSTKTYDFPNPCPSCSDT